VRERRCRDTDGLRPRGDRIEPPRRRDDERNRTTRSRPAPRFGAARLNPPRGVAQLWRGPALAWPSSGVAQLRRGPRFQKALFVLTRACRGAARRLRYNRPGNRHPPPPGCATCRRLPAHCPKPGGVRARAAIRAPAACRRKFRVRRSRSRPRPTRFAARRAVWVGRLARVYGVGEGPQQTGTGPCPGDGPSSTARRAGGRPDSRRAGLTGPLRMVVNDPPAAVAGTRHATWEGALRVTWVAASGERFEELAGGEKEQGV
jgi:hypothetical protein